MISPLQAAVQQWRELGLLKNRHTGETGAHAEGSATTEHPQKKRRKKTKKDQHRNQTGKKLNQTTLFGENLQQADLEEYGDKLRTKKENNFRVVSQNIHTLTESSKSSRSRRVVDTIATTSADVFLMAEVSLYWPKLEAINKWFERIIGKFRAHRALFGCNTNEHDDTGMLQFGGVGLVAVDESVN
jgi:hypothetical protein